MDCQVNFVPNRKHLSQIEKWLIEEMNETNQGFYSNWGIIFKAFEKGELIILTENDYAIGFLVFNTTELIIEIDIAELKPDYRKKGLGRKLIDETLIEFQNRGVIICELFCSPESSEPIWKSMGFLNFPKLPRSTKIRMYKILIPFLSTNEEGDSNEKIELWDLEPYQVKFNEPKWVWNLTFKENSRELLKPIIQPSTYDWQICWRNESREIVDKTKYFMGLNILSGSFLIIRDLPDLP